MRRVPRRLKALPVKIGGSFKELGRKASGAGVNAFIQQVVAGFFASEMRKLRLDQLHTILGSGVLVDQLIDEDSMPERWRNLIRFVGRFTDLERLADRIPELITPDLVASAIREARPDAFSLIINADGGGVKWFVDQTQYMCRKLQRIIRRVAREG